MLFEKIQKALPLYTLTSVFIFSILFTVHLLRCCFFNWWSFPLLTFMTLMCDSGVILYGEIRCWSLSGVQGLNCDLLHPFFLQTSQQLIKNCIRERIIRQGAFYFLENGGIYIYSWKSTDYPIRTSQRFKRIYILGAWHGPDEDCFR